jgi:hypothetical protein
MTNGEASAADATSASAVVTAAARPGHTHIAAMLCANCGAPLSGHFCSHCGQRAEHAVHSLWHFMREVTEDLTHADSRLWRTLRALLFKPGYLTQEFLAGRRVSYLPPLRSYLVLSVFFFLVTTIHVNGGKPGGVQLTGDSLSEVQKQRAEHGCATLQYTGPWQSQLGPTFRASCLKAVADNGRELSEKFKHNLPRAIFLTVPLLALALKPLYLRSRRYYVEHVLFVLHDHAFVFAALGLLSIVSGVLSTIWAARALSDPLGYIVICCIPVYYYLAMRRVYGQGPWLTLGKLAVLSLAYLATAVLVLVATAIYSVLAQ